MHTMARLTSENWLACHARSADVCGLREFYLLFSPAISDLCHFHPRRNPPENSTPEGNTRFAPGTLLLFEGTLRFPHLEPDGPTPPVRQHDGVTIAETRSRHGFTYATELIPLPEGPWPVTHRDAAAPALRAIDTTLPGAHALLDQGHWTPETTLPVLLACSLSLSTRRTASKPSKRIGAYGKMHTMLTKQPPGA